MQHSRNYSDIYKREERLFKDPHPALSSDLLWSDLEFSSNSVLSDSRFPENFIQPLPNAIVSGKESSNYFCNICSRYIYKKQKNPSRQERKNPLPVLLKQWRILKESESKWNGAKALLAHVAPLMTLMSLLTFPLAWLCSIMQWHARAGCPTAALETGATEGSCLQIKASSPDALHVCHNHFRSLASNSTNSQSGHGLLLLGPSHLWCTSSSDVTSP